MIATFNYREKALAFAKKLGTGASLDENSACLHLRNQIIAGRSFGGDRTARIDAMYLVLQRFSEFLDDAPPQRKFKTALLWKRFIPPQIVKRIEVILEEEKLGAQDSEIGVGEDSMERSAAPVDGSQVKLTPLALSLVKGKEMSEKIARRVGNH